jgi:hypothetical protein
VYGEPAPEEVLCNLIAGGVADAVARRLASMASVEGGEAGELLRYLTRPMLLLLLLLREE